MELFKLFGTIAVNNAEANSAIDDTTGKAQSASSKLSQAFTTAGSKITSVGKTITKGMAVVGTAVGAGATAVFKFAEKSAAAADTVDKMSQKIGISREAYQELAFICSQSGTSVDTLQMGMKTLTNQMQSAQSGTASAVEAFEKLGVTIYDNNGNLKDQETMMWEAMEALQNMENQTEKAALANDLFGRSGSELMPLLNGAAGSIDEMRQQAHDLGLVMSDETVNAGVKLTDTIDQVKRAFTAIAVSIGAEFMPMIQQAAQYIVDHMPEIRAKISEIIEVIKNLGSNVMEVIRWFQGLDEGTQSLIIKLGLFLVAAGPVLTLFGKVTSGVGNIIKIGGTLIGGIGRLTPAVSGVISIGGKLIGGIGGLVAKIGGTLIPAIASIGAPVLAVIAVIGALVAAGVALYKNWDSVKEFAGKCWDGIKNIVSGAAEAIGGFFSGMAQKASEAWSNIKEKVSSKAREMKENASAKVEELKENVVSKFHELKEKGVEKIESLKESAVSKLHELKDKGVEKIESLKEGAVSKFHELKESATEKIESLKEGAVSKFHELQEKASEKIENLRTSAAEKFNSLKENATEKIESLKEKGIAGFENLKTGALEKFEHLKSGISDKLESVKSFVSGTVQKLKDFFNFNWELPKIKLPHFNISGSFSLNPPSIPHIGVEWYKKAMDDPMVMDKPTAFGINASGQIMAGGEAGSEVVSGTETLMNLISLAVAENNEKLYDLLDKLYILLAKYLPAYADMKLVLDSGALVGELAQPMNEELARRTHMEERRN